MAARKCKYGIVKRGRRKGQCLKTKRRRRKAGARKGKCLKRAKTRGRRCLKRAAR